MDSEEFQLVLDDIPEEILIKIFSYLSPKSLKIQALVCSKWNRIIGSSGDLMKRYQLNLTCGSIRQSQNVTRDLQAIVASSLSFLDLTNITDRLLRIKSLQLKKHTLNKLELSNALGRMSNLMELSFDSIKLNDETRNQKCPVANLSHLEIVSMKYSDDRLLTSFKTTTLKSFSIHNLESQGAANFVMNFLIEQRNLERLKIVGTLGREFLLHENLAKMNFRLKYLKLSKTNLMECDKCLIELLRISARSLENLVIKSPTGMIVDEFVLTNLWNLKSLQVIGHLAKEGERYYKPVDPNYHIRHLKVLGKILHFRPFSKIKFLFDSIPDLESIDISKLSGDQKIVKYLPILYTGHNPSDKPSMRELRCFSVSEIAKCKPTYENLKGLYVSRIDDENLFNGFIQRNAGTLEVISIKEIDDAAFTRSLIVSAISDCIRLKHLKIACNSTAVVKMFGKILWNHSWTFEIKFKDSKKIIFNFPDDHPVFTETIRTWDDNLIREFSSSSNYSNPHEECRSFVRFFRNPSDLIGSEVVVLDFFHTKFESGILHDAAFFMRITGLNFFINKYK